MKLRIKGNSLRLRVTRSELAKLMSDGRIEETIHFGSDQQSRLTYVLEHQPQADNVAIRFRAPEVSIVLPTKDAREWGSSDQVGIYATVSIGSRGNLDLIIEKDFACLDLSDADDLDTFPNPNAGAVCRLAGEPCEIIE